MKKLVIREGFNIFRLQAMKKLAVLVILLSAVSPANAQWSSKHKRIKGKGGVVDKIVQTKAYETISCRGNMDIKLVKGREGKIKIEAQENIIPYIVVKSDGSTLDVGLKSGYYINTKGITITIPFEEIKNISSAGAVDIHCKETLVTEGLSVRLRGSGDIELSSVDTQKTHLEISGSGDITLNGKTQHLTSLVLGSGSMKLVGETLSAEIEVTGSGDVDALNMKADTSDITIRGSGDVSTDTQTNLEYEIYGSGDIRYKKKPSQLEGKIYGSGTVEEE